MSKVLWIAIAGGLGTALRYAVGQAIGEHAVPWATWTVNVAGSFLLGAVVILVGDREVVGVPWKASLGTGLLGGFTTYSAFNLEVVRMLESGASGRAAFYVAITLGACLAAGFAGLALARAIRG